MVVSSGDSVRTDPGGGSRAGARGGQSTAMRREAYGKKSGADPGVGPRRRPNVKRCCARECDLFARGAALPDGWPQTSDIDPRPRIGRQGVEHLGHLLALFGGRARHGRLQPPPRARQRQAFAEHQLRDAQHLIDVGLAVEPRRIGILLDPDTRKLLLPRAQDVGLELRQLTDVHRPEQLRSHRVAQYNRQYQALRPCSAGLRRRARTCSRMGVPSKPNASRSWLVRNRS